MREQLTLLSARLDALSVRERVLVLGVALAAVLMLWDVTLVRPLEARDAEVEATREQLQSRITQLGGRIFELERGLESDPHQAERMREASLRGDLDALNSTLSAGTAALIAPEEMPVLLEELLLLHPGLRVERLEALPAEPLFEPISELLSEPTVPSAEGEEAENEAEQGGFYRHGLRVELLADFADTVAFVQALEATHWSFFWDSLHYDVTDYPKARITLVLHTLSTREGWLGV